MLTAAAAECSGPSVNCGPCKHTTGWISANAVNCKHITEATQKISEAVAVLWLSTN